MSALAVPNTTIDVPSPEPVSKVGFSYLHKQFEANSQLTKDIFDDLAELAASGDFTLGAAVTEFEQRAGRYFKVPRTGGVVGVHSGTEALTLALKAMKVGPGDYVITVPNTFFATVGAIVATGAKPRFVDVDETYSMSVEALTKADFRGVKAVLPVHWYGMPADMDPIMEIAKDHACFVVEDACASVGARYKDRTVGGIGDINAISLHPLKTLHVWGDGGAVITRHPDWYDWLLRYRNHGMIDRDNIAMWGVNARLHSSQAVVANRCFAYLEQWTDDRRAVAQKLDDGLAGIKGVTVPPRDPERKNAYQLYVVQCERRVELLAYLDEHGIEAKVHYPKPLHMQMPGYEFAGAGFPVAEAQAKKIVSLPANQYLSDGEIDYMVEHIKAFYGQA